MHDVREAFSTAHNWCDRRCERCPIADECPLRRLELQRRWVHEARGRDPDGPEAVMMDMDQDITTTLRIVLEVAAEEGIDLDAPMPPRVAVLDEERLHRTSMKMAKHVVALARECDPEVLAATAPDLKILSMLLAGKVARIATYVGVPDADTWSADAVPNLLLLERLKRDLHAALDAITGGARPDDPAVRALAELDRLIDPMLAEIGPEPRALLEALIARDAAPSPFLREQVARTVATK